MAKKPNRTTHFREQGLAKLQSETKGHVSQAVDEKAFLAARKARLAKQAKPVDPIVALTERLALLEKAVATLANVVAFNAEAMNKNFKSLKEWSEKTTDDVRLLGANLASHVHVYLRKP